MDSQPEIGHKQESTVEYVEIGSKEWRAGKKDLLEEMDSHEGEQESRIEIYTDRLRDKRDESSTDGDNDEDDNTSYDEDDNGVDEGDDSKDKEDDDASTFLKMIGSLLGQIPKVTSATQYLRSQTTKNTAQTTPTQRTITTTFQQPTVQTAQAPTISTVQRPALFITMVTSKQGTIDQKSTNRITGSTTVNIVPSSGSATWTRPTPAATNAGTATIYYTRTTATPLLGANTKSHPVPSFKTTQSPFMTTRSTTMNTPGFINTTTSPSKGGNQRQSQSQNQQYGYQVGLGTTTTKQTSTTSANVNLTTGVATVPVITFHHQKSATSSTAPGKLTTTGPTPPPPSCYQCGDASTPCSPFDLLLGQPQSCPQGTSHCMVDIVQNAGVREVRKRCVDQHTCHKQWFDETSDQDRCITFDPRVTSTQLDCHFCCVTDNCNQPLKPVKSSWFMI